MIWGLVLAAACQAPPPAPGSPTSTSTPSASEPPPPADLAPRPPAPVAMVKPAPGDRPTGDPHKLPFDPISDLDRSRFAEADQSPEQILNLLREAEPRAFKPVGSTSTVFRVRLDGTPMDMAFKSRTRDRPRGPVAEAAAYRVARCLGLDTVPPAVTRDLPLDLIRARLVPDARDDWPAIARRLEVNEAGMVEGVAIYWIPDMHAVGVDTGAGIRQWVDWLKLGGRVPHGAQQLMAYLSTMLVFDYLIGNWDRFSGGNAKGNAAGTLLYLRDHDSAFAPAMHHELHRRVLDRMLRAERFSRSFYGALKALDAERLAGCLAEDPRGDDLLRPRQRRDLLDRRAAAVSHIGSLIELHGSDRVLVFP